MKTAFSAIVDLNFTANVESLLDMVEEGKVQWKVVVSNFYPDLDEAVKTAEKELESVKIEDEVTDVICEECGRNMVIKIRSSRKIPGLSGISGLPQHKTVPGEDRCCLPGLWKRSCDPQDEEGKKVLRM